MPVSAADIDRGLLCLEGRYQGGNGDVGHMIDAARVGLDVNTIRRRRVRNGDAQFA